MVWRLPIGSPGFGGLIGRLGHTQRLPPVAALTRASPLPNSSAVEKKGGWLVSPLPKWEISTQSLKEFPAFQPRKFNCNLGPLKHESPLWHGFGTRVVTEIAGWISNCWAYIHSSSIACPLPRERLAGNQHAYRKTKVIETKAAKD
jgi:hypothetical protein